MNVKSAARNYETRVSTEQLTLSPTIDRLSLRSEIWKKIFPRIETEIQVPQLHCFEDVHHEWMFISNPFLISGLRTSENWTLDLIPVQTNLGSRINVLERTPRSWRTVSILVAIIFKESETENTMSCTVMKRLQWGAPRFRSVRQDNYVATSIPQLRWQKSKCILVHQDLHQDLDLGAPESLR